QLAMAAIDEDGKLNAVGSTKIVEGIHCRANGPAVEQNIVHEHNSLAVDIEWDFSWPHWRRNPAVQVIAMHADVEAAGGNVVSPDLLKQSGQSLGQRNATALDPDEDDFAAVFIALGNFVGHASECALN